MRYGDFVLRPSLSLPTVGWPELVMMNMIVLMVLRDHRCIRHHNLYLVGKLSLFQMILSEINSYAKIKLSNVEKLIHTSVTALDPAKTFVQLLF
jgi:hypothetical protein